MEFVHQKIGHAWELWVSNTHSIHIVHVHHDTKIDEKKRSRLGSFNFRFGIPILFLSPEGERKRKRWCSPPIRWCFMKTIRLPKKREEKKREWESEPFTSVSELRMWWNRVISLRLKLTAHVVFCLNKSNSNFYIVYVSIESYFNAHIHWINPIEFHMNIIQWDEAQNREKLKCFCDSLYELGSFSDSDSMVSKWFLSMKTFFVQAKYENGSWTFLFLDLQKTWTKGFMSCMEILLPA